MKSLNKRMRYFFALLLGLIALNLSAQDEWDDDTESTIDDTEIVFEKDKKIDLPQANRNFRKIELLPPTREYQLKSYTFKQFDLVYSPVNPGIQVRKIKDTPQNKLYGNYLKAGFGNYGSPLAELFVSNKRSEKSSYGAHFSHFSSAKGPVDGKNSGSGVTDIGLFAKAFNNDLTFGANANYNLRSVNFYGYNQSLEVLKDTIEQRFSDIDISAYVENIDPKDKVHYRATIGLNNISDKYDASETTFSLRFKADYDLSESSVLSIDADVITSSYKDLGEKLSRNLYRFNPYYSFNHSGIFFKAGLNMVYENDTLAGNNEFHIYPQVEATYPVEGTIKFTAGLRGDIDRVSYRSMSRENPWIDAGIPVFNTNNRFELYGNIKGRLADSFDFVGNVAYSSLDNYNYFVNNPADSTRFIPLFDTGTTQLLKLGGEIGYEYKELFQARAGLEVFNYDTDSLNNPWHRPSLVFSLSGSYNLYDKIKFGASFHTVSGIKAQDPVDLSEVKLPTIADLNLRVEYLLSPRASVFLRGDNLFSKQYERYLNYPSRGVMVLAGVTYSF